MYLFQFHVKISYGNQQLLVYCFELKQKEEYQEHQVELFYFLPYQSGHGFKRLNQFNSNEYYRLWNCN